MPSLKSLSVLEHFHVYGLVTGPNGIVELEGEAMQQKL